MVAIHVTLLLVARGTHEQEMVAISGFSYS